MVFNESPIEQEIREAADALLLAEWDHRSWTGAGLPAVWSKITDSSWFDLLLAQDKGGLGLGTSAAVGVLRAVGRHLLPGPVTDTMAAASIIGYSPPIVTTLSGAFVVDGGVVTATSLKGEWADVAEAFLLVGDSRLLVVTPSSEQVQIKVQPSIDGLRSACTVDIRRAQVERLIDDPEQLTRLRSLRLTLTSAEILGVGEHVLSMTKNHAESRHQFGMPIAAFQAVRHRLAEMAVRVEAIRTATYIASIALDNDDASEANLDSVQTALIAKAHASGAIRDTVEDALQIHGGVGFTDEHELSRYFARALTLETLVADESTIRLDLGRRALLAAGWNPSRFA